MYFNAYKSALSVIGLLIYEFVASDLLRRSFLVNYFWITLKGLYLPNIKRQNLEMDFLH